MELVLNKKEFTLGALLSIAFFVFLFAIHTIAVISINGKSLVRYTDEMFVSVSKGSVYFIPELVKTADKYVGIPLDVQIKKNDKAAILFQKANAIVDMKSGDMEIKGDLGALVFGMLLANHPKATELANKLLGFKDLFLVGFFLSIGISSSLKPVGLFIALFLALAMPFKAALFFVLLTLGIILVQRYQHFLPRDIFFILIAVKSTQPVITN